MHEQPPAHPTPSPQLVRLVRLCMAFYLLYAIGYLGLWRPLHFPAVDYPKHWFAARAILEGRSPYLGRQLWMLFNYPQATAFAFAWLGWFSYGAAAVLWKLTLFAALLGAWGAAAWGFRPTRPVPFAPWWLIAGFAVFAFQPALANLPEGNLDAVNALLAVALTAAVLRGRERAAGVLWAALILTKLMPVVLLLPVALWRRWRIVQGAAAAGAAYALLLTATGRWDEELMFLREIVPVIPQWWRFGSQSWIHFTCIATGHEQRYLDDARFFMGIARPFLLVCAGAMAAAMAWLRWRRRADFTSAIAVTFIFIPLLSPLVWYHHYVWILPVLLLHVREAAGGRLRGGLLAALAAGWIALQLPHLLFGALGWNHARLYFPLFAHAVLLAGTLAAAGRKPVISDTP